MVVDWLTQQQRYDIGEAHHDQFKALYERTGMVDEHPLVKQFKFIKGSQLLTLDRIPEYRDIESQLHPLSALDEQVYFLSHRWLSPGHPDPDGRQLSIVRPQIDPGSFYWIDYTCLPQKPRTVQEERLFRESMHMLPSLMFRRHFLVLRCQDDSYFDRAWCFFELLTAHVVGGEITYVYETPELGAESHVQEQRVLERTLLTGSLPTDLAVTDMADMEAIQEAAKTITTFSILNLVSHYLALGQIISDDKYFSLEHRYYFMATCDFTRLLLWTYDTLRDLGMGLFELSRNEFSDNVFVKISESRVFQHSIDIYALPKEILLDEARIHWLSSNRNRRDSASNLFYLISSMIASAPPVGDSPPAESSYLSDDALILDLVDDSVESSYLSDDELVLDIDDDSEESSQEADGISDTLLAQQRWGHPDRLSIELDCPPGDPRPQEVFEMAIAGTGLTESDFELSEQTTFGRTEYLIRANPDSISRYRRARSTIKDRLTNYYNRGLIRAATW